MDVVKGSEAWSEKFAGGKKVSDICAGVVSAGIAGAIFIYRVKILFVLAIFYYQFAVPGVNGSVSSVACWNNTVEHIDAIFYRFDYI